jgi:uracil phosphoribosyltransferase
MAYQISRRLVYRTSGISTPLGTISVNVPASHPVLITVLRAGLAYFNGFVEYFDQSDCGFIGAYRKEASQEVSINLEYVAAPGIEGREVILIDPMLATGSSFVQAVDAINKFGAPTHIHIAALVASPQGIKFLEQNLKGAYTIWTCAIDDTLDDNFYIIPGLGDAGDLSFGIKL